MKLKQDEVIIENLHKISEIYTFAHKSNVVDLEHFRRELTSDQGSNRGELIDFGDCYVGKQSSKNFTLTNNSKCNVYRFVWDKIEKFTFKPNSGHLHPGRILILIS